MLIAAYLDAMMTGGNMFDLKLKKKQVYVLSNLISYALTKQSAIQFDEYLVESFDAYRLHKKEIILDLLCLEEDANKTIRYTLMHPLENDDEEAEYEEESESDSEEQNVVCKPSPDGFSNLFRVELLSLFPNVQSIIVTSSYGEFSMSMSNLLSSICESKLEKVVVKADGYYSGWIEEVWQTEERDLEKHFEESGFDIQFKEERVVSSNVMHVYAWQMFIITKKKE